MERFLIWETKLETISLNRENLKFSFYSNDRFSWRECMCQYSVLNDFIFKIYRGKGKKTMHLKTQRFIIYFS